MIPNKKARKRRCFRRSAGFPHFILFSNKTRQPFSQAGRTSAALFPKSTNKFYAFYLDNLTRRNHPDTMYFLQSLKKKGCLGVFHTTASPKTPAALPVSFCSRSIFDRKRKNFCCLQGSRPAMTGNAESGKKEPLSAHGTRMVSPI